MVPDDHVASIEHFLAVLAACGGASGVVHVGAHEGQEVDSYLRAGCERVVLVEANPEHCATLRKRFGGTPQVTVVECAVADAPGTARLHRHASRSGDTQAASLLALKRFRDVGTLHTAGTIEVPALTLDGVFAEHRLDPAEHDLLVLDVQGAELLALRGGARVVPRLQAVLTEVSLVELYDGSPPEEAVGELLAGWGFERVDSLYYELTDVAGRKCPAWGDSLFVRG